MSLSSSSSSPLSFLKLIVLLLRAFTNVALPEGVGSLTSIRSSEKSLAHGMPRRQGGRVVQWL